MFGLLVVFQLYRFAHTHSMTLAVLITIDVAVCYLIWREWRFRRELQSPSVAVDDNRASQRQHAR